MKKILPVLTAMLILLLPLGSAFATTSNGETGLSHMKSWYLMTNHTNATLSNPKTEVSDDDPASVVVEANSSSTGNLDTLNYVFTNSANIKSYYADLSRYTEVDIIFTDINGNTWGYTNVQAGRNSITPPTGTQIDITNIKRVSLRNTSLSNTLTVREFDIFGTEKLPIVHDEVSALAVNPFHNEVNISFTIPNNSEYTGAKIYKNGTLLTTLDSITNVYKDTAVQINTQYTYKVTATYSDGFETSGLVQTVTTPSAPADTTPPAEVTNLQNTPYNDKIDFTFDNPVDLDFKHVNIYQNGVLIASTPNGSYTVLNLTDSTTYNYKFTTVDTSGNESAGVPLQVTTLSLIDTTPPDAPKNVSISNASNGGTVKWDMNTEKDLAGYNLYVNGIKDNTSLITNNSYSVIGLSVGSSYDITVTAVDKSGNESLVSLTVIATPVAGSLPILKLGYDLKAVSEGTGEMFGSIWLIVAFSVAIPLGFYISGRTKLLFLN